MLANGKTLPISSLKGEWFDQMLQDHILVAVTHGSRKSLRISNEQVFLNYLDSQYAIRDIEKTIDMLSTGEAERSEQVQIVGSSKFYSKRTFTGFLVNCYQPIKAILNGEDLIIKPVIGSYIFINDYKHFQIDENVVIVGIENAENFNKIGQQKYLFDRFGEVLFVARYPQSKDLRNWLSKIPNQYIHFGDFDLAGMQIFESEFYNHLGLRASFFVPDDIETRFINSGNSELYNQQYMKYRNYIPSDLRLMPLFEKINHYHKCYEQEGYIL